MDIFKKIEERKILEVLKALRFPKACQIYQTNNRIIFYYLFIPCSDIFYDNLLN